MKRLLLFILIACLKLSAQAGLRQAPVVCFGGSTTGNTLSCSFSTSAGVGDILYVISSVKTAGSICPGGGGSPSPLGNISDGVNTYTGYPVTSQGGFDLMQSWSATVTGSISTITLTYSTSSACFIVNMYDVKNTLGVDNVSLITQTAFPSITTTVANDFIIAVAVDEADVITFTPTGWTVVQPSTNNVAANGSVIGIGQTEVIAGTYIPPPVTGFSAFWTFFQTIAFIPSPIPTNPGRAFIIQ